MSAKAHRVHSYYAAVTFLAQRGKHLLNFYNQRKATLANESPAHHLAAMLHDDIIFLER
ncbi:MAG: hypothetical protein PVJ92_01470 [Candidatus Dependentiae bacterium]|jgi:hypothetical protein